MNENDSKLFAFNVATDVLPQKKIAQPTSKPAADDWIGQLGPSAFPCYLWTNYWWTDDIQETDSEEIYMEDC